ncbi:MAG: hypothetical protein IH607_03820 [Firmicutes bacterium]|nr:hypothetical protein [Bacillota bacterium]
MKRNILVIVLCILLGITTGASASLASLEDALSPLLSGQGPVKASARLTVKTLMPFDDTRIGLINRVLAHTQLNLLLDDGTDESATGFHLSLGGETLFEVTERLSEGAYLMQTSLLPNRMLFSTRTSPMDTLLLSQEEEETVQENSLDPNTSDVEEAFDMLTAVEELRACYRALTDKTILLTEQNKVSYAIDNIGKGRYSYVAKLTGDQSNALLSELRAVLSCGMDAQYRAEIANSTFARGFTVALYRDADEQDISLYMKGTILYPDGDRRKLKWQWSFTPDGKTQTFEHKVSREEGRRDTRNIDAILKRSEGETNYALECETTSNLRRGGKNETSTLTIDLSGGTGDVMSCKGSVTRETGGTYNGEDLDDTATIVTVDLQLKPGQPSAELTGTASYSRQTNGTAYTELDISFIQTAQTAQDNTAAQSGAPADVEISILPADTAAAIENAQSPTQIGEIAQDDSAEFLVGTPPAGLYAYEIPAEMITIHMDNTQRNIHQSLMNEAAQRLASNLVTAILNLPANDRALLADGMTETDYAIFLAMLD